MDPTKRVGTPANSQEIAAALISRSAYLTYSALGLFFIVGFLASSPLTVWAKLKLGFPFAQVAVTAYQVQNVWAMRPLDFWNDMRVRLSLMVFAAASLGPFVVLFYFVFFPPRFAAESGGSLSLASMSLLFVFYGVLLVVSPRVALRLDYVDPKDSKSSRGRTSFRSDTWLWRLAGVCFLLVGSLLAYAAVKLLRETISR